MDIRNRLVTILEIAVISTFVLLAYKLLGNQAGAAIAAVGGLVHFGNGMTQRDVLRMQRGTFPLNPK